MTTDSVTGSEPCCRVRETLDFAARVQGVGVKQAELESLLAKSGSANAPSDADIDAFLTVCCPGGAVSACHQAPGHPVDLCQIVTQDVE